MKEAIGTIFLLPASRDLLFVTDGPIATMDRTRSNANVHRASSSVAATKGETALQTRFTNARAFLETAAVCRRETAMDNALFLQKNAVTRSLTALGNQPTTNKIVQSAQCA